MSNFLLKTYNMTTASGTQTWTGLSFQPSLVLFISAVNGVGATYNFGFDNGTQQYGVFANTASSFTSTSFSVSIFTSTSNFQRATITSFTSDGFVLTWTKTGTPTGTADIVALCFK
jgi:hypothetical protein